MIVQSVVISGMDPVQTGFNIGMGRPVLERLLSSKNQFSSEEKTKINRMILEYKSNYSIDESSETNRIAEFGRNLSLLFDHASVTFIVNKVSLLEAMLLKKFSGGKIIDLGTSLDDEAINPKLFPKTQRAMRSLFLLMNELNRDSDVEVKPGVSLLPIKCIEKSLVVRFEGTGIQQLIGSITQSYECYFVKLLIAEIKGTLNDEYRSNCMIEYFMTAFYSYMKDYLKYIDILSDSMLDHFYLNPVREHDGNTILNYVDTIFGGIDFVNQDSNSNDLLSEIVPKTKYMTPKKDVMKSINIYISSEMTLYSFLEAYVYLPYGTILESTDIKILYSTRDFIIPIEMSNYVMRVKTILDRICDERDSYADKSEVIDRFNLIPLNSKIQFTMKFNLYDLSDILLTWESDIRDREIYGETNHYISRELLKLIDDIKTISVAVYNTFLS